VVAKLSTDFLAASETFIYDEIAAHQRYATEVLTLRRQNEARFSVEVPVHALTPGRGVPGMIESALCRVTCLSPTFFRLCRTREYALVHAHFGTGGVYALPYRRHDRPLVVTFHGHEVPLLLGRRRFEPKHWGYWALSRWLFRRADRFLAVSPELVSQLIALGAPASRVHLFDLGIKLPPRPLRREGIADSSSASRGLMRGLMRVLMIGRFVEKKGFAYGIRAFARVARDCPTARLVIVGTGPGRKACEDLVQELGIAERVDLLGDQTHAQVWAELARADVLLAPSVVAANGDREGTPTVIKEGMAHALPVLASHHGGIPRQVVDGQTGFLVAERDVEALASRLRLLLENPALRATLGQAGRLLVEERFDRDRQIHVLEDHYDDVLGEQRLTKAA
jgi:glycosyltransferase involved in cell wall biosynthesis